MPAHARVSTIAGVTVPMSIAFSVRTPLFRGFLFMRRTAACNLINAALALLFTELDFNWLWPPRGRRFRDGPSVRPLLLAATFEASAFGTRNPPPEAAIGALDPVIPFFLPSRFCVLRKPRRSPSSTTTLTSSFHFGRSALIRHSLDHPR